MKRPSPLLLLMGGGALINVAVMLNGAKLAAWARHGGMAILIALGVASLLIALRMAFEKKPERTKYTPERAAPVDLLPETKAKGDPGATKASAKRSVPPSAS